MLFSIYGFDFDVPKETKIQIFKGSLYFEGTVEFTDFEGNIIKADWNEVDKIVGKDRNIKDFFDDFLGKIKSDKSLNKFNLKEFPHEGMADHEYYFYKLEYTTSRKFPYKEINDYLIGFGTICPKSNRVMVVQYRPPEGKAGNEEQVMNIIRSFRCKCMG